MDVDSNVPPSGVRSGCTTENFFFTFRCPDVISLISYQIRLVDEVVMTTSLVLCTKEVVIGLWHTVNAPIVSVILLKNLR